MSKNEKRGPGRPPTKTVKTELKREGIVHAPSVTCELPQMQRVLELVYGSPPIFKKVFSLLKAMNAKKGNIYFKKEGMIILSTDVISKNIVCIKLLGRNLTSYYCEEEFEIGINISNLIKITNKLTKAFEKVTFWTTREDKDQKLNITLYNGEIESTETSKINVEKADPKLKLDEVEKMINLTETNLYEIAFSLDSKIFKKKITDSSSLGNRLRIEKDGANPLQFITPYAENVGDDTHTFENDQKINLRSNIGDDLFSTTVYLSKLRALANSTISDKIEINLSKYEPIVFTAYKDNGIVDEEQCACVIQVLVEVIDFRKNEKQDSIK